MDTFPDLGTLTDHQLKDKIQELTEEEHEVSYRRRILHGKIDILRAELVNRLKRRHQEGEPVITDADVQQLADILAGKSAPEVALPDSEPGGPAEPWQRDDDPEEGPGRPGGGLP